MQALVEQIQRPQPLQVKFTEREQAVFELLAQGLSNSQIAVQLHLSAATIKGHVGSILAKLGVNTRAEAIANTPSSSAIPTSFPLFYAALAKEALQRVAKRQHWLARSYRASYHKYARLRQKACKEALLEEMMPRPKKRYPEREKALEGARDYLRQHIPELGDMPLHLHVLDVVPGAPRYAVTAELCHTTNCPHGIELVVAQSGNCPIMTCRLRHSVKLLLNDQGEVMHETRGDVHWG